jgi:hypothetical protein
MEARRLATQTVEAERLAFTRDPAPASTVNERVEIVHIAPADGDVVVMLECTHAFHRSCLTDYVAQHFRIYDDGQEIVRRLLWVDTNDFPHYETVQLVTTCPVCRSPISESNARELKLTERELGRWRQDVQTNQDENNLVDAQYAHARAREEADRLELAKERAKTVLRDAINMNRAVWARAPISGGQCLDVYELVLDVYGRPIDWGHDVPFGGLQNALAGVTELQALEQAEADARAWGRAWHFVSVEVPQRNLAHTPEMTLFVDTHPKPVPEDAVTKHALKLATVAHLWVAVDPDGHKDFSPDEKEETHGRGARKLLEAWLGETYRPNWRADQKSTDRIRKQHYDELTAKIEEERLYLNTVTENPRMNEQEKLKVFFVGETCLGRLELAKQVFGVVYNLQRVWQSTSERNEVWEEWNAWQRRERQRRVFESFVRVINSSVLVQGAELEEWHRIAKEVLAHWWWHGWHFEEGDKPNFQESPEDERRREWFDKENTQTRKWRADNRDTAPSNPVIGVETLHERDNVHADVMDRAIKDMLRRMISPDKLVDQLFTLPVNVIRELWDNNKPQPDDPGFDLMWPGHFLKLKEKLRPAWEKLTNDLLVITQVV